MRPVCEEGHSLGGGAAAVLRDGPRRWTVADLAWTAGSRWHIEECFKQAKNEAGPDHYQVHSWRAWYAHITLSMLALAWLSAIWVQAVKGNQQQRPGHDRLHVTENPPPADQPHPALPFPTPTESEPGLTAASAPAQGRACHYRRRSHALT
jgi:hypothetical protein